MANADAEVWRVVREYRAALERHDADAVRLLTERYLVVENALEDKIVSLAEQLKVLSDNGETSVWRLYELERYKRLQAQLVAELAKYNADAARIIAAAQAIAVDDAEGAAIAALTAGAPEGYYSALDLTLNMTDWQQLGAMIGNTADGTPLARLMDEVGPKTRAAVDKALQKSVALGRNPKVTAAEIRRVSRMPLQRALLISRTEQMRVAREASTLIYRQAGVTKYERVCSYDDRTCIACIAADGTIYDVNVELDDHPRGRCVTVPIIPDPNDPNEVIPYQRQGAIDWFRTLDAGTQQAMMGQTRWSLWKQNYANFKELGQHVDDPVWGGSVKLTPIRELMAEATGKLDGTKDWALERMKLKFDDYHHLVDDDGVPYATSLDRWILEDGTLDPVRAARHERIVERFCSDRLQAQERPLCQRIGGASASGKSTMKGNGQIDVMGDDIAAQIDADEVKKMLPEFENALAEGGETAEQAAAFVHEESSYLAKLIEARALERKVNYVTDGVNDGGLGKCINQIKLAQDLGYRVEGFFATVPTEKALEWATKRAKRTGRKVPHEYIRGAHESVSEIFPELAPYFDEVKLFDNWSDGSGVSTLIAQGTKGNPVEVLDPKLWTAFLEKSARFRELGRKGMDTRLSHYGKDEVKALRKALHEGDDKAIAKALDELRASYVPDEFAPTAEELAAAVALRHEEYEKQLDDILDRMLAQGELPPPGTGFGEAPAFLDPRNFVDGQLTPERRDEYKAIIRKMVPEDLQPQELKRAQMLGGGTASGKSTTVESGKVSIMGTDEAALINADDAKEMLHEYNELMVRGEYKEAANHVHEESSFLAKAAQRLAMRRDLNFVIDGTNDGGVKSAVRKVELLKDPKKMADQLGCSVDDIGGAYRVEGVFCSLSQEQAFRNAESRAAGKSHRWVNPKVSLGNHTAISDNFAEVASHYDDIVLYDNQIRGKPRMVARCRAGQPVEVIDEQLWADFVGKSARADGKRRVAAGEAEDVVQRQLNDELALVDSIERQPFELSAAQLEDTLEGLGLDDAARQRVRNYHHAARAAERKEQEVGLLQRLERQTDPYGMTPEDFDAFLAVDAELRELERFGIKVDRAGPRSGAQHNYRTHVLNPRDRVDFHHEVGHAWQDVMFQYSDEVPEARELVEHVKSTVDLWPPVDPGSVPQWEAFARAYDTLAKGGKVSRVFDDVKFAEQFFPSEAALSSHLMSRLQAILGLNDEQMEAYVAKQAKRLKLKPKELRFWNIEDRVGELPRMSLPTTKDIARKRLELAQMRFDELFAQARVAVADHLPSVRPLKQMTKTQASKWLSQQKLTGYADEVWAGDSAAASAAAAFKADARAIQSALREGTKADVDRAFGAAAERALPAPKTPRGVPDERVIKEFHEAFDAKVEKFGLTPHTDEELRGAVVGVSKTGATYAVLPDGDIVSVTKGLTGEGSHAVVRAIEDGGTKLDCFDGKLKSYYEDFGFVEKGRMKWDDAYAPSGWDYAKYGRPDIVLMELDRSRYARYLESIRAEAPGGLWRDDFARSVGADAARSGRAAGASEAATAELRRAFDSAISASPATASEVTAFRYLGNLDDLTGGAAKVGDTFVERGYLSTSLHLGDDVPRERDVLDITVPKGEHALAADVLSDKREYELIFGSGRELRVTGERYVDEVGRLHLPVELVPKVEPPPVVADILSADKRIAARIEAVEMSTDRGLFGPSVAALRGDGTLLINPDEVAKLTYGTEDLAASMQRLADSYPAASAARKKELDGLITQMQELADTGVTRWAGFASDYAASQADAVASAVHHELGHVVYDIMRAEDRVAFDKTLASIWRAKPLRATGYSGKNRQEWFSESWALFRTGHDELVDPRLRELFVKFDGGAPVVKAAKVAEVAPVGRPIAGFSSGQSDVVGEVLAREGLPELRVVAEGRKGASFSWPETLHLGTGMSDDELREVAAHEIGHYRKGMVEMGGSVTSPPAERAVFDELKAIYAKYPPLKPYDADETFSEAYALLRSGRAGEYLSEKGIPSELVDDLQGFIEKHWPAKPALPTAATAPGKPPTIKELGVRPSKVLPKEDIDKVDAFMATDDYAAFEVKKTLSDMSEELKGEYIAAGGSKHEGDRLLPAILKSTGGDAKPELVDVLPTFDLTGKAVTDVAGSPIYRGVTRLKYADDFREGDFFASTGLHGSGSYFGLTERIADDYVGTSGGEVIRAVIKPDARIIPEHVLSLEVSKLRGAVDKRIFKELERLKAAGIGVDDARYWEAMEPLRRAEYLLRDQGKVAALLGYDGVYVFSKGYVTIVNRGCLIVERRAAAKGALRAAIKETKTPAEKRMAILTAKAKGPGRGDRAAFADALTREPLLDEAARAKLLLEYDIAASGKSRVAFLSERASATQEAKLAEGIESVTGYTDEAFESMLKGGDSAVLTDAAKERLLALNKARQRERALKGIVRDDEGRMTLAQFTGLMHKEAALDNEAKARLRDEWMKLHKAAKREQTMRELYVKPDVDLATITAALHGDPLLTEAARTRLLNEWADAKTLAEMKAKEVAEAAKYEAQWLKTIEAEDSTLLALPDEAIRATLESISSLTPEARVRLLARAKELKTAKFTEHLDTVAERHIARTVTKAVERRWTPAEFEHVLTTDDMMKRLDAARRMRLREEFTERLEAAVDKEAKLAAKPITARAVDPALVKQLSGKTIRANRAAQHDRVLREVMRTAPPEEDLIGAGLLPKNYFELSIGRRELALEEAQIKFAQQRAETAAENVQRAIDEFPVQVRVPASDFDYVLADGRWKTQFETHTSRGANDNAFRARNEAAGFGYPQDLDPTLRPVYGYIDVGRSYESASQYGELAWQFGDDVRARTTVSYIDSLGAMVDGRLCPSPMNAIDAGFFNRAASVSSSARSMQEFIEHYAGWDYLEAQVHGGLRLAEAVGLSAKFTPSKVQMLAKMLKQGDSGSISLAEALRNAELAGYDSALRYCGEHGLPVEFHVDIRYGGGEHDAHIKSAVKFLKEHFGLDKVTLTYQNPV